MQLCAKFRYQITMFTLVASCNYIGAADRTNQSKKKTTARGKKMRKQDTPFPHNIGIIEWAVLNFFIEKILS